jgi:hypothetical protein
MVCGMVRIFFSLGQNRILKGYPRKSLISKSKKDRMHESGLRDLNVLPY